MPKTPDRKISKRRWIIIVAGLVLLLGVAAVFLFLNSPKGPWAPTTMEYGDCGDDCVDLGLHNFAHAGEVHLFYDKDVDDAVVQWATCLESAISCIKAGSNEDNDLISACVAASACPKSCQADYAGRAKSASSLKDQLLYFQQTFLKEGSLCRPVE